jgi:ABC-2 type transport system ATP-binding protein
VKELSKGMQQKAQIIVTLLHRPELVIVDEPFSGLDPVNTQMVKDLLREECDRGTTILLCSHQMHQVEALCDRLVLIDHGRVMLYGRLDEIRRQYAGNAVEVRVLDGQPDYTSLPGVTHVEQRNGSARLTLGAETSPQAVLQTLVAQNHFIEQFEVAMPTLDEIFIQVVQGAKP